MLAVSVTALVPALTAPVRLILPEALLLVRLTLLLVAALSVMPVTVNVPVLSKRLRLPLVVLVPLKLVMALVAVSNKVPVAEFVVNKLPVMMPLLFCVI